MADPVLVDYNDPENVTLAEDLFGTAAQDGVEAFLDRYCQTHRSARLETVFRSEFSVGGVFGVSLTNGAREIIKVWPPHANRARLKAHIEIQSRLHGKGFPAPKVYAPPSEFEGRPVMAMEVMDGDIFTAHDPDMRNTLATLLHDFIRLANEEPSPVGLDSGWLEELKEDLWPKPHNALFDFEATQKGAEWIDAIATEARKVLLTDPSPAVVTHLDWGCRNMLAKNGQVTAVFDWDSVYFIPETQAVGDAAAGFLTTWYFDVPGTFNAYRHRQTPVRLFWITKEQEAARSRVKNVKSLPPGRHMDWLTVRGAVMPCGKANDFGPIEFVILDDSDTKLAYRLAFGFHGYDVGAFDVTAGYSWTRTDRISLAGQGSFITFDFDRRARVHQFTIGARYAF